VWSVCLCASACPVCPVCVPAPPGVFLPVSRARSGVARVNPLSGPRAWGSGECARVVLNSSSSTLEAPREVHVRQVTLLLRGETPPRRARVRAAAAAAAASSGPIGIVSVYSRGGGCASPHAAD
jgi:hypothetical protein